VAAQVLNATSGSGRLPLPRGAIAYDGVHRAITAQKGACNRSLAVPELAELCDREPGPVWHPATAPKARHDHAVCYALREFELSLKGETPSDVHQVEHIAPQKPTPAWEAAIPAGYEKIVHTWGNLLPLTSSMNPSTGQGPFEAKRMAYAGSIFASAREVAKIEKWDAEAIRARSSRIAEWAVVRWPY
jgi:hypothetical protein